LVDIYLKLNFCTEDQVEFQWGSDRCADIRQAIEKNFDGSLDEADFLKALDEGRYD
jgi:hypothetical protein